MSAEHEAKASEGQSDEPSDSEKHAVSNEVKEQNRKERQWRWRRSVVLIALAVLLLSLLIVVRKILLPFILATVIAYILAPVVQWISNQKVFGFTIPRWIAVILIYLTMGIGVYAFAVSVLPRFADEFVTFAEEAPQYYRKATQVWIPQMESQVREWMEDYTEPMTEQEKSEETGLRPVVEGPGSEEEIQIETQAATTPDPNTEKPAIPLPDTSAATPQDLKITDDTVRRVVQELDKYVIEVETRGTHKYLVHLIPQEEVPPRVKEGVVHWDTAIKELGSKLLSSEQGSVSNVLEIGQKIIAALAASLINIVLTLMLAAFILIDTPRIMGFFRSLSPPKYRNEYDDILKALDRGLGGVVRGQLIICLVNGLLTGIGLVILGVKYPIILALIAAIFSLVPIFGTILSSIPSTLIAATQSMTLALFVIIWIAVIHLIEANLLNPKIIGTTARIHPVLVVFALVAGEYSYGLFGALLAVPVFSMFQNIFLHFRSSAYPK